jgi:hypothetical protein
VVYIGNLSTSELENNDINLLMNHFTNSEKCKSASDEGEIIEHVRVFKDSVYVSVRSEKDAENAASFFNGFKFKSFVLKSFFVDLNSLSSCIENQEEAESFSDYANYPSNERSNKIQFRKVECEIIVANRCLK